MSRRIICLYCSNPNMYRQYFLQYPLKQLSYYWSLMKLLCTSKNVKQKIFQQNTWCKYFLYNSSLCAVLFSRLSTISFKNFKKFKVIMNYFIRFLFSGNESLLTSALSVFSKLVEISEAVWHLYPFSYLSYMEAKTPSDSCTFSTCWLSTFYLVNLANFSILPLPL